MVRKLTSKQARDTAKARMDKLSPERRIEIARVAAASRWDEAKKVPRETHTGVLPLGDGIECSVLDNGMRVLSVNGITRAFGSGAKGRIETDAGLVPPMMAAANLQPFIDAELRRQLAQPVSYRAKSGGRLALGYEAEILHKMCGVLLDARAGDVLRQTQLPVAQAAELLMRGFAKVGLVALIDEATGYQAERARGELYQILEAYIAKELLPWTKKFPDEFFEQVYRIHGWRYEPGNTQRPQYVGHFINRTIYEQLPEGVLDELRKKNPPVNGSRRFKHFQLLTKHTGNPHLDKQVVAVTTTMKLSSDKEDFKQKFRRLFPKRGDQAELFEDPENRLIGAAIDMLDDVLQSTPRTAALRLLADGNTVPTKTLAQAMYGKDTAATLNKARQLLNTMKEQGLIVSPSPGLWQRSTV